MKTKGFRQIDNEYYLAFLGAGLNRSCLHVLLTVIHFTLGYGQRSEAEISLTTFQELTGLTRTAVITAIRDLISFNMISRVRPGSTGHQASIYRINTDFGTWVVKPTIPALVKPTIPANAENYTSTSIVPRSAPEPVKKERKPLKKVKKDNAASVTECGALSSKYKKIIAYYRKAYREHTGKPHPFMKAWRRARVVAKMESFEDEKTPLDYHDWTIMIDYHFRRRIKTDWRIYHFATPGVLENLFYKNLY